MSSDWIVHTDGASRGNPGKAAFAYVITRPGQVTIEHAEKMPDSTNNQAEYTALVEALRHLVQLKPTTRVCIHSDSELLVKQMNGIYQVKDAGLRGLYTEALQLASQLPGGVTYTHVRRGHNKRADELCNLVLDGKWKADSTTQRPLGAATVSPAPALQVRDGVAILATELDREAIDLLRRAMIPEEDGLPAYRPDEIWAHLRALLIQRGITFHST
jgi:ribonuclease HI